MFLCSDNSILFMPKYAGVNALKSLMDVFSEFCSVWKNRSIQFVKPDGPVLPGRAFSSFCSSSH
jgi:hypothetical protein